MMIATDQDKNKMIRVKRIKLLNFGLQLVKFRVYSALVFHLDRPPSYPEVPSPFLENPWLETILEETKTPPPNYDSWFKDGIFQTSLKTGENV